MIGLDTSHVIAFTQIFNDPKASGDIAGVQVVAGFPGGSDIPDSKNRVRGYTEELQKMGIEIVESIPKLLEKVDVVLLESVDGHPHLEQAAPVFRSGKPVFIDKPLAGSLADALAIYELGKKHRAKWFSSSSLRFSPGILGMRLDSPKTGPVTGCEAWGPCPLEPSHPDLFWYGIHGVEILYTIMGPGCERVVRVNTAGTDLVAGTWKDGRVGTFRGIRRGKSDFGAMVFGEKGIALSGEYAGYQPLAAEVARFFKTGEPPVSAEETIELMAFMEAADESKRRGGAPVPLAEVLEKARGEALRKIEGLR
ncbi:MAG: Gfo/Idh/MocA family oxidoreductase [Planctomycetes bacterium]|nr:Gfo/Idh/MocA family oxidoreductase [Planctomycetota bacterium]